jgi:3'(2'), 5'-bisphosphate nucleotidase
MQSLTVDQNEQICRLMLAAGQRAWQSRCRSLEIFEKGVEDYVTNVDRALDHFLAQGFKALFPMDGIITEENVASCQLFQSTHQRLWLIDPLDGTADFIHQGDSYAVMVGVLKHHSPQAGWIYAPAHQCLYWGGQHWGIFYSRNNAWPQILKSSCPQSPVQKSPSQKFCSILLGYRDQNRFGASLAPYITGVQCTAVGSFGLKVLDVIQGKAGLFLYLSGRVKLWDTVAPLALAQAAGLMCCDLTGQPLIFNASGVDPNTLVHQQAIIVGWPSYVKRLLPKIRLAVQNTLAEP